MEDLKNRVGSSDFGWKAEHPELSVTRLEKRFRIDPYLNPESFRNALQKAGLKK
jgi:hypothetical protein